MELFQVVMFYFSRQLHYSFVFFFKRAIQVNINFINIQAIAALLIGYQERNQ